MMKNFNLLYLTVSVFLLLGCSSSGVAEESQETASDTGFDGVYEFVRMDTPDGPRASQKGTMIVADGTLCHVRVNKEREGFSQEDDTAAEERVAKEAAAFNSANAACGPFTQAGDRITATWTASLDPNDDGNTPEFIFRQEEGMLFFSPAVAPQFSFGYRKVN